MVTTPAPTTRRRKRRRYLWIVPIVVVLLVGGALASRGKGGPKPVTVTFEPAIRKTITQLVSANGRVQPEVEVKIAAEVAGEIVELPVSVGQQVRKGDLLLRIKPDFYQRAVEQQEAALASARAGVLQAEAVLRQRELDLRDAQRLFEGGVRAESELRAAQVGFETAQAQVAIARADVLRAEAAVKQATENLDRTTILSPMDGTVTILNSEVGDRVVAQSQFSGTEIMRVADIRSMEVRVNVNESDVVNVKLGDSARISVDAHQAVELRGTVREIAGAATTTGQGSQDQVTNFEVKVRIIDPGVELRPGMSATADIETATAPDVIAVPIQSVAVRTREDGKTREQVTREREEAAARNRGDGAAPPVNEKQQRLQEKADRANLQRVVFIKNGDVVKQVTVETGLQDNTHIEVKTGVDEGAEVVSGSFSAITRQLKDGSRWAPEKPKKPATPGT